MLSVPPVGALALDPSCRPVLDSCVYLNRTRHVLAQSLLGPTTLPRGRLPPWRKAGARQFIAGTRLPSTTGIPGDIGSAGAAYLTVSAPAPDWVAECRASCPMLLVHSPAASPLRRRDPAQLDRRALVAQVRHRTRILAACVVAHH